jgi:hypothetical protein
MSSLKRRVQCPSYSQETLPSHIQGTIRRVSAKCANTRRQSYIPCGLLTSRPNPRGRCCMHRMLVSLLSYTSTLLRVLNISPTRSRQSDCSSQPAFRAFRCAEPTGTIHSHILVLHYILRSVPSPFTLIALVSLYLHISLSSSSLHFDIVSYTHKYDFSVYHPPNICTGTDQTPSSMLHFLSEW